MKFNNIAVLGSNSFAGATFISNALERGVRVIGFNRSAEGPDLFLPYRRLANRENYKFYQADLNSEMNKIFTVLGEYQPEVIVDFAGQGMVSESWENPTHWYVTNLLSKVKLHEYLRHVDWLDRYVRISTPEVYGSHGHHLKESWTYNPSTPYAVSHASIDMSLRAFHTQYGFPVVFNRFANFYGPGQQLYRIVPRTIIFGLIGKKLQLHGGGNSIRAFIHGEDVANGIFASLERGEPGEVYHFSSEHFLTIREVIELICERANIDSSTLIEVAPDRPGKDQAYLMDSSRARNELDWSDKIPFKEGIDQTIDWVKANLEVIRKLPLQYIHKA